MKNIAIIVGHGKSKTGGYDSGACANGYQEFQLAKEIAKYTQRHLSANYNCTAELYNYKGDTYLTDRVKQFQSKKYDMIAEIHLNAGGGTGPEVYYSKGNSEGKKAAEKISAKIAAEFGLRNRGAKTKLKANGKDYFAIIRDTVPTAVLVETLFIDTDDVYLVNTAAGQEKMGKAAADGIADALLLDQHSPQDKPEKEEIKGGTCKVEIKVLKKGAKGSTVKAMQTLLIGYGYSCGNSGVDGSFGGATDKALRAYQKAKGLEVDGSCGPATWRSLLGM